MQEHTLRFASELEAKKLGTTASLEAMRQLSLDEFAEILSSMPNNNFTHLSNVLPNNATDEIQHTWTGSSGETLLAQSAYFVNSIAAGYSKLTGRRLGISDVLDFGCGWGRLLRLMLYYVPQHRLFGSDAWDVSLDLSRKSNIPVTLEKTSTFPCEIGFGGKKFDLIYLFSIFTHLPEEIFKSCLSAIRKNIKEDGVILFTVRSSEYWKEALQSYSSETGAAPLIKDHNEKGFAFLPAVGAEPINNVVPWGDASISLKYLNRLPGWRVRQVGRSLIDPYQVSVWCSPV